MTLAMEESLKNDDQARVTATTNPIATPHRVHYLDNLRAIAMLLGVFLHAGLAYATPSKAVWLATDPASSVAVDASIWLIHLFRMSLFFLLSGYFAKLVIERKGLKQFVWGRCLRIALPFVIFYPFLLVAMSIVIVFSLSYLSEPQGLMGLIANAARAAEGERRSPSASTMHLWFLYYLMYYTAIGALMYQLKWLNLDRLFQFPKLLVLYPLLLVPAAFVAGAPLPAPESFVPHWWPFAFYGLYYFAGWQLYGREQFLARSQPFTWHLLAVCAVLYVPYYWLMPVLDFEANQVDALVQTLQTRRGLRFAEALLTAYLSVLLTMAALLLGQRWMAAKSSLLSFVSDASYWVYLLHLRSSSSCKPC